MNNYMSLIGKSDKEIITILLKHMDKMDYKGLDPSAIHYNPHLLTIVGLTKYIPILDRLWNSLIYRIIHYLGHRLNGILRTPNVVYSKGIALVLSALAHLKYMKILEIVEIKYYSNKLFELLNQKRLRNFYLWAHDIDYKILNVKITSKTPNLVTTAFVAKCYWDWWCLTRSDTFLETFNRIIKDMITVFTFKEYTNGICFMYTPNSDYHVHNANLLMAELLTRYYSVEKESKIFELIYKSISYTLDDIKNTNSIPYAGPPTINMTVDNYHTGYVLRSLKYIMNYLPNLENEMSLNSIIKNGVDLYINKFIKNGNVVRDTNNLKETHSLAEAILIHKEFSEILNSDQKAVLFESIKRTVLKLWDKNNFYFINNIKPIFFNFLNIKDKTDMIRWSQSWIIYALAFNKELE